MGDRGDPRGPWQDYGGDTGWGERAPAPGPALPPGPRWYDDYSDEWTYDEGGDPGEGPLRRAAGEVAWRYRSAPMWFRVAVDVSVAALVLAVVAGAALALRGSRPSDEVGAFVAPTSTTVGPAGPTSAPVPLGGSTTTSSTTTTTVRPTTTIPPTTTTVAPTTTAPPPSSTTTTTRPRNGPPGQTPHYDNCFQAWRAGALPLNRGDPGYGPHLDDDNDGVACEWGEGF